MESPIQRNNRWRWSRFVHISIIFLFVFAVCLPVFSAADYEEQLDWQGHGSENAFLGEDCTSGFWHWILTPGGNNVITKARLSVTYSDEGTSTTEGYSNNPEGRGAWHFDVTYADNEVVEAYVEFNYEGSMADKFILTISNSHCVDKEKDDENGDDENGDDENGDDENGDDENGDDENGDLPPTGGLPTFCIGLAMAGLGFLLKRRSIQ